MVTKILFAAGLVLVFLMAGFLFSYQAGTPDLPPGISAADWIPITQTTGVLLTRNRKLLTNPKSKDLQGILYLKIENVWHRVYLEQAPVSIIPAR